MWGCNSISIIHTFLRFIFTHRADFQITFVSINWIMYKCWGQIDINRQCNAERQQTTRRKESRGENFWAFKISILFYFILLWVLHPLQRYFHTTQIWSNLPNGKYLVASSFVHCLISLLSFHSLSIPFHHHFDWYCCVTM